jgi:tRNA-splicing ligase RtcB (3'-phosphate/5'-hydroxy nucleic acid ligase)
VRLLALPLGAAELGERAEALVDEISRRVPVGAGGSLELAATALDRVLIDGPKVLLAEHGIGTEHDIVHTESEALAAANFDWGNRALLAHRVRESIARVLGPRVADGTRQVYDVAHNVAKLEQHHAARCACTAREQRAPSLPPPARSPAAYRAVGQPVFIPGSMGTSSFVLAGREGAMQRSFGTACHGAADEPHRRSARDHRRGAAPGARGARDRRALPLQPRPRRGGAVRLRGCGPRRGRRRAAGLAARVAQLVPLGVVKG